MFSHLKNLYTLDFSHNSLSVRNTSMVTLPPKLHHLGLASCNMKEFPRFSADAKFIEHIDLSKKELHGEIPHGIGSMSWDLYSYLNLSRNRLTGGLEHINWNDIWYLDIQSNLLNGSLPNLFCNSSSLKILNLSYNNLSGVLPIYQTNLTRLLVFDLRMNNIQGNIPPTFSNFRNLKSINLYGNKLEGRVPTSFSELEQLETLDLGSNQLHDTFPQCLESLPNIRVLVLKSNNFHGLINQSSKIEHPFPNLRIIDLSNNRFSGPLPEIYIENFKAMMMVDKNKQKATYMGLDLGSTGLYSDSTGLVINGVEIELVRILTGLTAIDVSKNNFEGKIPEYIGNLASLRYLNLSHNFLAGHIPSSIGKLSMLESLDLSSNVLEGEIPQQLTAMLVTWGCVDFHCPETANVILKPKKKEKLKITSLMVLHGKLW
ncbi:uncharacterized protein LOC141677020 isoform X1 [Apium graveolens]|uniref:uncharacterized protein LOC141677020 isoform X1 n=1 Tax=Apium graveolens TaxID=4045 RepID=UPI003D7C0EA5